ATAVVFEDQVLTYRQLNERANQLAHHLHALGAGPGHLVGLCLNRSADLVVPVLGVLNAGAASSPLDPAYPKDRLRLMPDDPAAPVLLTQDELRDRLPEHRARVVCLDSDWPAVARHRTDNPTPALTAEDRAYVIYTSGSTGKPKGVILRHRRVVNTLDWVN